MEIKFQKNTVGKFGNQTTIKRQATNLWLSLSLYSKVGLALFSEILITSDSNCLIMSKKNHAQFYSKFLEHECKPAFKI